MELVVFCDESDKDGEYYSNFYGGALVRSVDLQEVIDRLETEKNNQSLNGEIKWQKIGSAYQNKYQSLVDVLFNLIREDKVKIRIMFTQNLNVAIGLEPNQRANEYFLLYYQFIKHAFGFQYSDVGPARVRLILDQLPDTSEKVAQFKGHIASFSRSPDFRKAGIFLNEDQIAEVDSRKHIVLQCLDVVLGSMQFRLNDKHKAIPKDAKIRGARTRAKEQVYSQINSRIRSIYPGFNIGMNTSIRGDIRNRWADPYRHWLFKPSNSKRDLSYGKNRE